MPGLRKQEGKEYNPNWGGARPNAKVPRPNRRKDPNTPRTASLTLWFGEDINRALQLYLEDTGATSKTEGLETLLAIATAHKPNNRNLLRIKAPTGTQYRITIRCTPDRKEQVNLYKILGESMGETLRRLTVAALKEQGFEV